MFCAIYRSIDQGLRPFATIPMEDNHFPPSVTYGGKSYRHDKTYQVDTPSQEKSFSNYCREHDIESNVKL